MTKQIRLGTNKVFTPLDSLGMAPKEQQEMAVDKFLATLKIEIMTGRVGDIETSIDTFGSTNIRVCLDVNKNDIEELIMKKLNEPNFNIQSLYALGIEDVQFKKLDKQIYSDELMCIVHLTSTRKAHYYLNGRVWSQKVSF